MHDIGVILPFSKIRKVFSENGYDLDKEIAKHDLKKDQFNLPFVYVFGRGKFTATIYGANIYPDNMREVLSDRRVRTFTTGKFTLETKYIGTLDPYLNINVELAKDVKKYAQLAEKIAEIFVKKVRVLNSEYSRIYVEYGVKVKPRVALYSYADPSLFPVNKIKKSD